MEKVELWRDIPNYENYQASNWGRIKSKDRIIEQFGHKHFYKRLMKGQILKPRIQNGGYEVVWLSQNGKISVKTVHRLIAITFMGDRKDMVINHIDGNKRNNQLENLEWVTHSDNLKHDYHVLHHRHNACKIRCIETNTVYNLIKEASNMTGISASSIGHVINGINKTAGGLKWHRE